MNCVRGYLILPEMNPPQAELAKYLKWIVKRTIQDAYLYNKVRNQETDFTYRTVLVNLIKTLI